MLLGFSTWTAGIVFYVEYSERETAQVIRAIYVCGGTLLRGAPMHEACVIGPCIMPVYPSCIAVMPVKPVCSTCVKACAKPL